MQINPTKVTRASQTTRTNQSPKKALRFKTRTPNPTAIERRSRKFPEQPPLPPPPPLPGSYLPANIGSRLFSASLVGAPARAREKERKIRAAAERNESETLAVHDGALARSPRNMQGEKGERERKRADARRGAGGEGMWSGRESPRAVAALLTKFSNRAGALSLSLPLSASFELRVMDLPPRASRESAYLRILIPASARVLSRAS